MSSTYVLIPGAGGDARDWYLVVPRLRALSHEVVAPALPAADEEAGLDEYADTVLEAIGDRTELVVVAHSMGAYTAPLLCRRADVRLLVLVAPMIPAPGESLDAWGSNTGAGEARRRQDVAEGRDPDAEFDDMTAFLHDVPDEVVAEVMARGWPRQADKPWYQPWPLDAWPDVPTSVLACARDRIFPLEFMRRVARERLGVEADVIDSGHMPSLSRPDELTQRLESYRTEYVARTL